MIHSACLAGPQTCCMRSGVTIGCCGFRAWHENKSGTLSAALQAADALADAQTVEELCFAQRSRVVAGVFGHGAPKSRTGKAVRPQPNGHKKEALLLEPPHAGAANNSSTTTGQAVASATSLTVKGVLARPCRKSVLRQMMCGGTYCAGRTHDVYLSFGVAIMSAYSYAEKLAFMAWNELHPVMY